MKHTVTLRYGNAVKTRHAVPFARVVRIINGLSELCETFDFTLANVSITTTPELELDSDRVGVDRAERSMDAPIGTAPRWIRSSLESPGDLEAFPSEDVVTEAI